MASNTALNNETICDLSGQPLDRGAASLLKAIDKLLTVGAYYSTDHEQYCVVSEKSCAQIVEAIGPQQVIAIEITASGMMIRSQLIYPQHRNVRLLHDLLVPLNIARLEISADLTPADLRQAVSALQDHKLNLGNTTGFQEIKIDNLPPTVSTASRSVVGGSAGPPGAKISLDELLQSFSTDQEIASPGEPLSESEKLAREFMEVVGRILENMEQSETEQEPGGDGSEPHPDSTPENIRALREALRRLVEVNPDPSDLARLIEHAKRALDLSQDPGSVDLVFSLLKKEIERGGDWKYRAGKGSREKAKAEYSMSLDQMKQAISDLEVEGDAPAEPGPSALDNYLGICFYLLASDPSEALEISLRSSLERVLAGPGLTRESLNLCSAAVATTALKGNPVVIDRVLPSFSDPLRNIRPDFLAKFWVRLWESLDQHQRAMVWPHLVNDLLLGLSEIPREVIGKMWLAAGGLDSKLAIMQVSRLECTASLRGGANFAGLMRSPLTPMYPVHLALMKSSLAEAHALRIHNHLRQDPPNDLTMILMKAVGEYDPANDSFYLSLIKQNENDSLTPDLRRMAARLISECLNGMPPDQRSEEWVIRAIDWVGRHDADFVRPLLASIRDRKKYFFFPAWPKECRELAQKFLPAEKPASQTKDGS